MYFVNQLVIQKFPFKYNKLSIAAGMTSILNVFFKKIFNIYSFIGSQCIIDSIFFVFNE